MPRIFIAIGLPESVNQKLDSISYGVPGARWEDETKRHLSLRFIGEVANHTFQVIRERLDEIKMPGFKVRIKGVGVFPPKGESRIIWAGVESWDHLSVLYKKIETLLVRHIGLKPEGRKYHPHITLARLKKTPGGKVADFIMGNSLLKLDPFWVREFHLYTSVLSPKGSKYYVEGCFPLGQPPGA